MNSFIRFQNMLLSGLYRGGKCFVPKKMILTLLTLVLILTCLASNANAERFGISRREKSGTLFSSGQASSKQSTTSAQPSKSPQPSPENSLPNTVSAVQADTGTKTASNAAAKTSAFPQIRIPKTNEMIRPLPNVVRLIAFDSNGQSFGSGSYIGNYDDYGLILSNWHVVCESDSLVHVHFPNGFSSFGAIVNSDKTWDLAMIVVSKPPQSVPSLPIARTIPKPGDALWIAGHGSGSYRLAGGTCIRYLAPEIPKNGTPPLYEIIELSVTARQGDSGGPILNQDGELAGVLFGSDMVRNTAGSYCQRVNRFLGQTRSELDRLPKRPEEFFAVVEPNGPKRQLVDSLNAVPTKQIYAESSKTNTGIVGTGGFGVRSPSRRHAQPSQPNSVAVFETQQASPYLKARNPSNPAVQPTATSSGTPGKAAEAPKNGQQNGPGKTAASQSVRSAVWNEPLAKSSNIRQQDPKTSILQTKHNTMSNFRNESREKTVSILSIPNPFDNNLSSLNPNGSPIGTIADLPQLSAIPHLADTNEAYGRSLTENKNRNAKRSAGNSFSYQNATHPIIWGSVLVACLATVLVFISFRLMRAERKQSSLEGKSILKTDAFRRKGRQDGESDQYSEAAA